MSEKHMETDQNNIKPKGYADGIPVYCAHDKIVSIAEVKPNPMNPNKHGKDQLKRLKEVIEESGWRNPITISTRSGLIVKGHGRALAAKMGGWQAVPVDYQNYATEAEELADLMADNYIAELSDPDEELALQLLSSIRDAGGSITAAGYTQEEYDALMKAFETEDAEPEEDSFDTEEELAKPAFTKAGDIWKLGTHRLICGDATDSDTIEKLMDGEEADLVITDPPYGVDYHSEDGKSIKNDTLEGEMFIDFLTKAFEGANAALKGGGVFYIWHSHTKEKEFMTAAENAGWKIRECLVWVKNIFVMGRQDYQWKHEPCLYGWKEGGAHYYIGDRNLTTIIQDDSEIDISRMKKEELKDFVKDLLKSREEGTTIIREDKPLKSELHPTMKPIKLIGKQVHNSSRPGENILDPFGGSGSTLIACEQLNRRCFTAEIDPKYADVIVKRYVQFSGNKEVELIRNGKTQNTKQWINGG